MPRDFYQLKGRLSALKTAPDLHRDFVREMQRFLPAATARETVEQATFWEYLTELVRSEGERAMAAA